MCVISDWRQTSIADGLACSMEAYMYSMATAHVIVWPELSNPDGGKVYRKTGALRLVLH